jgi:hypothetical protein
VGSDRKAWKCVALCFGDHDGPLPNGGVMFQIEARDGHPLSSLDAQLIDAAPRLLAFVEQLAFGVDVDVGALREAAARLWDKADPRLRRAPSAASGAGGGGGAPARAPSGEGGA